MHSLEWGLKLGGMIECAAWRRKRETERRQRGKDGGGVGCLVLKTRKRGGRKRRADRHGRSFRGGGEGRLAGAVSVERGAELKKAQAQLITRDTCVNKCLWAVKTS